MVVVDTSVWIDLFHGVETQQTRLLDDMPADEEPVVADLCLFEILQGIRIESEFQRAYGRLQDFRTIAVAGKTACIAAAQNARLLRRLGVQPSIVDCLIATYCVSHDASLLTTDKDFEPFVQHLGLVLAR